MDDQPPDDAETPMQRALRLKKAKLEANLQGPRTDKFKRRPDARAPAGASKPWMTR